MRTRFISLPELVSQIVAGLGAAEILFVGVGPLTFNFRRKLEPGTKTGMYDAVHNVKHKLSFARNLGTKSLVRA